MQRIGMISSVSGSEDFGDFVKDMFGENPELLYDLMGALFQYNLGKATASEVQQQVAALNRRFVDYLGEKDPTGKLPRGPFYQELADFADHVTMLEARGTQGRRKPGSYGRLEAVRGRVVFREPGPKPLPESWSGKGIPLRSVAPTRIPMRSAGKVGELGAEGIGSDSAPLLYSLMGAGVGYAVARKNRGMATGIGALVGFLATRFLTTPATPADV